ncbi:10864_t:CDS:2 [Funneliformis mosseae]|uniref:10864_t:CDS:1 n=1 Tax=Funneliformis mosseae TaxID=27381 RepID=A0A9N9H9L6_FUNMO|nr:10864_t:CDS:2 [Funneliformis mosseae]
MYNLVLEIQSRPSNCCGHITNEATRCEYIFCIIYEVVSIYGGEIKVYPQYEISESYGKGPVD